jgi:hypothetical protein
MKLIQKTVLFVLFIAGVIAIQSLNTDQELRDTSSSQKNKIGATQEMTSENLSPEEEEQQLKLQFWSCKSHQ